MSELRKEKNCLNCGITVEDTYCPHCGQKNIRVHQNAFHALAEFVGDYFHADGKFFSSIIPLLFRPGKMTIEYNEGRRMKYIHPFRLYIFISIVFFFIYFSRNSNVHFTGVKSQSHSAVSDSVKAAFDTLEGSNGFKLTVPSNLPATVGAYDDSVSRLSPDKRPGFVTNFFNKRIIRGQEMGSERFFEEWQRHFFHNIPTMMFFLLPVVALILKLLYIRRKKFYIDHLIFSIHIHSFVFFLLIMATLLHVAGIQSNAVNGLTFLLSLLYLFIALRNVYRQGYFKTLFKFTSFLFLYLAAFCLIFLFNLIYTTANI